ILSMHTSPLAQPGTGDGGGMNVYVRELATALARAGVRSDVYTRADGSQPAYVDVEPGLRVHHIAAGPLGPVDKHDLPGLVDEFADGVQARIAAGNPADALHANYWLSGVAGHELKHRLELPLVSTFHTLDRVKAEADASDDNESRVKAEVRTMACSDAILASGVDEVHQLVRLYDVDRSRIEIVAPGVDHAFFAPGDRRQARRAIGLPVDSPVLLSVGRIQPLKGLDVAIRAASLLRSTHRGLVLVIVGGPSGVDGLAELDRLHALVDELDMGDHVRFVAPQPHELLSSYYRAADVCLVPSRTESFGLVALEAAACGTPVVAAAVGGLRTLVRHALTGFLVEGRAPGAFASFAGEILDNQNLAEEMSGHAARVARDFTWSIAAARLRRLYGNLTARQLVECP
ncbi:MAG: glycosyltransferase, partial [Acidimicrobiales bacterium]